MSLVTLTKETLEEVNKLFDANAKKAGLTTATGLVAINLEATAKLLVPEFSPLRSEIPRVTPPGNVAGLQPQWKQITSFNSTATKLYVPEGKRGALLTYTTAAKSAPYVTLGLENNATFEAESAGVGFEDIDDVAVLGLMQECFSQEERVIIGGNAGLALGQTATPVLTDEASGGTLGASATYVGCVGLTFDGLDLTNTNSSVPQVVTYSQAGPAGGSTTFNGGSAIISAVATITPGGANHSVVATVAAMTGAVGYAWFVSTSASHTYFYGTSTINSIAITAIPSSAGQDFQTLTAAIDYSQNSKSYDGLLSQIAQGGYTATLATGAAAVGGAGTGLTASATGQGVGIVEIDAALLAFWNTYRTQIDEILVNAQELINISNKVLSSGSAPLIRFNYDADQIKNGSIVGGAVVGFYLNKFAMGGPTMIPIKLHPYVPAGTIILRPKKIPYNVTNVGTILRMNCRKDYYQIQWPQTQRQREWGVYWESVLQNYAPFAFGVITNIANK